MCKMKKFFCTALFITFAIQNYAQDSTLFILGDRVINLTIGFGNASYSGSYYKQSIPPLAISFEKAKKEDVFIDDLTFGIGGYFGYSQFKYEYNDWGYRYNSIIIGARGSFHYPLVDKLDLYTGLLIGADILLATEYGDYYDYYGYSRARSGVVYDWFFGGRYYIQENLAILAELGFGISYFNIGIAMKKHK